jgi:hypothetical protein
VARTWYGVAAGSGSLAQMDCVARPMILPHFVFDGGEEPVTRYSKFRNPGCDGSRIPA